MGRIYHAPNQSETFLVILRSMVQLQSSVKAHPWIKSALLTKMTQVPVRRAYSKTQKLSNGEPFLVTEYLPKMSKAVLWELKTCWPYYWNISLYKERNRTEQPPYHIICTNFSQNDLRSWVMAKHFDGPWPPCSPDLTTADFYLWPIVKCNMYTSSPAFKTFASLKRRMNYISPPCAIKVSGLNWDFLIPEEIKR